jgi:hypothetical protein
MSRINAMSMNIMTTTRADAIISEAMGTRSTTNPISNGT